MEHTRPEPQPELQPEELQPEELQPEELIDGMKSDLYDEFKKLTEEAITYKRLIEDSKTNLRKQLYTKKLLKVNKRAYLLLSKMSIYDNVKKDIKNEPIIE